MARALCRAGEHRNSRLSAVESPPRCTSPQAAAHLGVSLRVLADLRARRLIPYYKIAHRVLTYEREDLDAFLARRRVKALGEGR